MKFWVDLDLAFDVEADDEAGARAEALQALAEDPSLLSVRLDRAAQLYDEIERTVVE